MVSLALTASLGAACGRAPVEGTGEPGAETAERALLGGVRDIRGVNLGPGRVLSEPGDAVQATLNPLPPRDYLPPNLFCRAFGHALCDGLEDCGCGEGRQACYEMIEDDCVGNWGIMGPQARRAIGGDRLLYDGYAAFDFVMQIAEGAQACQSVLPSLGWNRRQLIGFDGVFSGTVPNGMPCELPFAPFRANECADGVCMLDASGKGSCVEAVDVGEACHAKTVCFEMDRPLELREFVDGTFFGRCAPLEGRPAVCQGYAKVGALCASDAACRSGRCEGKACAPRAQPGEACATHLECADGFCDRGACRAANLAPGAVCAQHEQCASQACVDNRCAEPICRR